MTGWKQFLLDYLVFSRKDKIAIVVILIMMIGIFLLPDAIKNRRTKSENWDNVWVASLKKLEKRAVDSLDRFRDYGDEINTATFQYDRRPGNNTNNKQKGELFFFDPNTLSTEGWQKLGLRDKTIHTIQNYLTKGGKFRKPEDVQRIYGLFPNEYERIAPYIKIAATGTTPSDYADNRETTKPVAKTNTPRYSIVDVNTADTTALIALPGIGSKLAARIINFRDKLGGFYAISQVGETFGLPDSTFQRIKQYLKAESSNIKKININTASVDQLKVHPYIKWSIANPLIAYRKEHGLFAKLDDLKKVMAVTDDIYNKIAPYLSVE
jgi:competence protein ComEA